MTSVQGGSQRSATGFDSYGAKVQTSVRVDAKTAYDDKLGTVKVDKNGKSEDGTKYLTVEERDAKVKNGTEISSSLRTELAQSLARKASSAESESYTKIVED